MGRIDESIADIESIDDGTERAFQLAGLISTLFKLKGIVLIVTGQLAFDCYANSTSTKPELEMASLNGKLTPRLLQEVMAGQLAAKGLLTRWTVANVPIHFQNETLDGLHGTFRDFNTENGVVKLFPAEDIVADRILAATYPVVNFEAQTQARLLLINALTEAYAMDWPSLHNLCHQPDYRIGEELAQMRAAAKKDVDAMGIAPDPVVHVTTQTLPTIKKPRPGDELANLY